MATIRASAFGTGARTAREPATLDLSVTRRQMISLTVAAAPVGLALRSQAAAAATGPAGDTKQEVLDRIEQSYDGYAATYDRLDDGGIADQLGFPALRGSLLSRARGDVLETGVGTGLNLPFYRPARVASLTAVDISSGMLAQAQRRAQQLGVGDSISFVRADVERLPEVLHGRQFDTVVDTFSLCVFPDPVAAVRSMAECLRPGGTLLLLEHSRSSFEPLGWYQDLTAPAVAATGGKGCRWNDNVSEIVAMQGLRIQEVQRHVGGLIISLEARKV